jgi:hypothetical protein
VTPDPAAAPIDFARAGEGDLEALAELMNTAYGGTGDIPGWTHVKDFLVGDRTSVSALRGTLLAWYERRGYKLTGESHAFPYDDNRYGVAQRPDLEFLELEKDL